MKKTAIFTIVTKNYIGLANVLMQSVADNGKLNATETFIFLADEKDATTQLKITADHLVDCKNVVINNDVLWNNCAFKYNVTEFCTFLKPYSIEYLYAQGFTHVVYFDPDIYVFNELTTAIQNLTGYAVMLTPHVTTTNSCSESPVFSEISFANNGIFNLGFIAVNDSAIARNLVNWWKNRVSDTGYLETSEGLATDQKWMDFAPAFLGKDLLIERGFGYNAGFWNIQEREIIIADNSIAIKERNAPNAIVSPLVFFHFSAIWYPNIYDFSKSKYAVDFLKVFPDLGIIFKRYSEALDAHFSLYSSLQYSYNSFDNGMPVNHLNRRLYRRLIDNDNNLVKRINPFENKGPFYKTLQKHKLLGSAVVSPVSATTAVTAAGENKNRKIYTVFRLAAKLFGVKAINKIISAGKSLGKEEAHIAWLQKDFYKNLNN